MDISSILYALTVLHAAYLLQLSFRQPSTKTVHTPSETWPMWLLASPLASILARTLTVLIAAYHVVICLALTNALSNNDSGVVHAICPTLQYLDPKLFTWSASTLSSLALLYVGSYTRFRAYAQLGQNFTYRLAKPDQLVTSGLYAYVRHPSYTGLLTVLVAMYALFIRQRGVLSCWAPLVDERLVLDGKFWFLIPTVGFSCAVWAFMMRRVEEEEAMMEKEYGQQWREYCRTTKKFVPFVY